MTKDVVEQLLFSNRPLSPLCRACRNLKIVFVEHECHRSEDYVHTLLNYMLAGIDLRKVIHSDFDTGLAELVILISTNYPNLICDGDRHDVIGLWAIEDQIKSVRETVVFDSLYIGIRSLVYSVILII